MPLPKSCNLSVKLKSLTLKLRLAATDKIGSTHEKIAAIRIILPVCGSSGSRARWKPSGVSSSESCVHTSALIVTSRSRDMSMIWSVGGSSTFCKNRLQDPSSRSLICRRTSSIRVLFCYQHCLFFHSFMTLFLLLSDKKKFCI